MDCWNIISNSLLKLDLLQIFMTQYPDLVNDLENLQKNDDGQGVPIENTFPVADITSLYPEVIKASNITSAN